ncbi:MAG: hypothetical protein JKY37_01225 [Nannocystaceae bacterium]|nr:hypothetical protein [Nannocystaceae bacterium]
MRTIELRYGGEVYEVRPSGFESPSDAALSAREVDALLTELWNAREYAQLWALCEFLPSRAPQGLDPAVFVKLRDDSRTFPRLCVHRARTHPIADPTCGHILDLRDLIVPDDPAPRSEVHFFECLIKDQDGDPIGGFKCRVEPPDGDAFVRPTNTDGLIRFDDLPSAAEYRITPLPGGATNGGGTQPGDADDWFECALVGSDGEALIDQPCEVITADGVAHPCKSDGDGVIRIEGLGFEGDCELRFLEAG